MEIVKPEGVADLPSLIGFQSSVDPSVTKSVMDIISQVKSRGDDALREFTKRFDGWDAAGIEVSRKELEEAWESIPEDKKDSLKLARERVERYHRNQVESSWFMEENDSILGMLVRPLERVGVYVPGGRAAYPSTVIMNVVPAKVAGVKEVIMCVPAPGGYKNPYVLGAAYLCHVDRVFLVGGAQAIAAMAFGTETVPKVDKIVGPGNIYVAEAKRLVYGEVDIDSIAGPSEVLVIADESADPRWVAADLLSQCEHDPMARATLVSTSRSLIDGVMTEIRYQLEKLPTKEVASSSWQANGVVILADSLDEAAQIANEFAPEHLEVVVENPWKLLPRLKNAGAIFLGPYSPEPIGDYIAGPNHTLPTGGRARFSSPLGVYHFYKRTSLLAVGKGLFNRISPYAERIAEMEGLWAHRASLIKRREGEGE